MRILVLEQDKYLSETLKEFFEQCGHSCDIANDRKSAVLLLFSQKFDTVIADLPLPDFDYHDLLYNLQSNGTREKIRVFIATSNDISLNTATILREIGIAGIFETQMSMESLLDRICPKNKKLE